MKNYIKKVCMISSAGGHLEQLLQLKKVKNRYECFYVLPVTKATEAMEEKKYLLKPFSRKNKLLLPFKLIKMFFTELHIFLKEKPDAVITTGAGIAVPMCLICKLFGKKVLYIESFAKRLTPNKTGKFVYKFADLFIVQWEEMLSVYPKAKYGGWIY